MFTTPWSWQKNIKFHFRTTITEPWSPRKRRFSPYCHCVHYAIVMSKKHEVSFHQYTHYVVIYPEKINFNFNCYYVHYVGDHNKNIHFFNSILHSPSYDHEKEIMIFLPIATTFTTPWFWQKNIVLLLLLRSLRHDYNIKTNYFSFQHYFHYTVILRAKYCFTIATTFTTPWSRQKINLYSFQHYLHYKVLEVQCF